MINIVKLGIISGLAVSFQRCPIKSNRLAGFETSLLISDNAESRRSYLILSGEFFSLVTRASMIESIGITYEETLWFLH